MLRRISADLGEIPAARLTVDDLVGWATKRRDEGAGPYAVNMDMSKLGTVFRYAGEGLPDVVGLARPKLAYLGLIGGGGKRERRPTEDELQRICDALPKFADAIRFAVLSAMRRGEVARIEWDDLDAEKRLVLVRARKDPRKARDEWVPLLGGAWDIVQRQPRTDKRIFPFHPVTLSKAFTEACRELGIVDLHLHDLRHDGVSRLFEAGYAIQEVAMVSGHKRWDNLKRYTNLRPEDLHKD